MKGFQRFIRETHSEWADVLPGWDDWQARQATALESIAASLAVIARALDERRDGRLPESFTRPSETMKAQS